MRKIFYLFLVSTSVLAAEIPLSEFDQDKLQNLLSQIASSFQMSEEESGFVRKYFSYPNSQTLFKFHCTGDYYNQSKIPSFKACKVNISEGGKSDGVSVTKKNNEFKILIKNSTLVGELFRSISYSGNLKQIYSNERIYGKSYDGTSRDLFRYAFKCTTKQCEITFTDIPPEGDVSKAM